MSAWDVTVDGVSLNTLGSGVSDLTGLGGVSGRDYFNQNYYAFDGETSVIGGLAAGVWGMTVWVDDTDRATGVRPDTIEMRQAQAWLNLQWLTQTVNSDAPMSVLVEFPSLNAAITAGQKSRTALCQLITMATTWDSTRTRCTVTLGLKVPGVWWRPPPGGDLDSSGYKTLTLTPSNLTFTSLPTDVYPMNGAIEDSIISVRSGVNPLSAVNVYSRNRGAASPLQLGASGRSGGILPASSTLIFDCKAHTAQLGSENVMRYTSWAGGRPGSMLRIQPPYQVRVALTPVTSGASVSDAVVTLKYKPSFI